MLKKLTPMLRLKKGDRPIVGKPSLQEVNWRGERIKKGIKLYTVGIDKVKEVLLSRCRIDKPGPKFLNLPQDAGRFWCQGFAGSEVRMQKHRNVHPYYVWETVQGVRNEHSPFIKMDHQLVFLLPYQTPAHQDQTHRTQ